MKDDLEVQQIPPAQVFVVEKDYRLVHYCPHCHEVTKPAPSFLTVVELEILREIGKGTSVKKLANLRHVSHKTIEAHIQRLCEKLAIPTRTATNGDSQTMVALARYALRIGLSPL